MSSSAADTAFTDDSVKFPICFESKGVRIYSNPNDEVFIEAVDTGATMRLNARNGGLEFTACSGEIHPIVIAKSVGYRVQPRRRT